MRLDAFPPLGFPTSVEKSVKTCSVGCKLHQRALRKEQRGLRKAEEKRLQDVSVRWRPGTGGGGGVEVEGSLNAAAGHLR